LERRKKEWALRHAAAEKARKAIEQAQYEAEEARKEVEERRRKAKVEVQRKAEQQVRATAVKVKGRLGRTYASKGWRVAAGVIVLAGSISYLVYAGIVDASAIRSGFDDLRRQFVGGSPKV